MAPVMMKCPTTGKPFATGLDMDQQTYESSTLEDNFSSCPYCGQEHTWSKGDTYLGGG